MLMISCMLLAQSFVGQLEVLEPQELEVLEPAPDLAPLEPQEPAFVEQPAAPPEPVTIEPQILTNPNFAPGIHAYVNASSLALRSGPKKDAGLVHYISRDEVVIILDDVLPPVPLTLGNRSGFWIYIQHKDHKGYVFDAFLLASPPSLQQTLDLVCVPGKKVGPITSATTYQDLALLVGEVNLAMARIPLEEQGKYEEATAVFPGDKHKELIIQWDVLRVTPKAVIVHGTNWKTSTGLGIGTRLDAIVEKNKAPISFLGFGHEYAGYVSSWGGGALSTTHALRKSMLLYLEPEKPYSASDFEAVQGEKEFSSSMAEVQGLNLKVNAMTIILNKPKV